MKIVHLTAENVKKIKAIEITPNGSLVQITGRNASGKSSVLDSIFYALAGGKGLPSEPIRRGEKQAKVKLDLGEIIVTRKFTATGSTLVVELANGARAASPQRMLDELIGSISFDPLAFSRMEPKEQFEMLRKVVKLDVDLDALAGKNKTDFENRTDINRRSKALRAQADGISVQPGLPEEAIDVAGLLARMEEAGKDNALLERRKGNRAQAVQDIAAKRAQAQQSRDEAGRLRKQADACDSRAKTEDEAADELQTKLDTAPALPEPVDASAIRAEVEKAQATNRGIEARNRRRLVEQEAEGLEKQATELTEAIEARNTVRAQAIARAAVPVAGIGFGEGVVLYNELPFDQASSAEQIRVSVAIAMAANPKLRVLRIKEGSLLDDEGMDILRQMTEAADYQAWVESVDTTGKVGVVMEDGAIVANNAEPKALEATA